MSYQERYWYTFIKMLQSTKPSFKSITINWNIFLATTLQLNWYKTHCGERRWTYSISFKASCTNHCWGLMSSPLPLFDLFHTPTIRDDSDFKVLNHNVSQHLCKLCHDSYMLQYNTLLKKQCVSLQTTICPHTSVSNSVRIMLLFLKWKPWETTIAIVCTRAWLVDCV